jgi:catechol 2,3-dioxygenase-like lactoylglutathione lyase family enzyme
MTAEDVPERWTVRSTLVAVTDLDRSVAFYRELGPFEEVFREGSVAMLGETSPASLTLILREVRSSHQTRYGQASLGLRSIHFNVGTLGELDRIESVLRGRELFSSRLQIADGVSELVFGRDPDNMPLLFVCFATNKPLGPDYYRAVAGRVYSLDV